MGTAMKNFTSCFPLPNRLLSLRISAVFWMAIIICPVTVAWADIASPHAIHERQPDGTEIVLFIRGNMALHWQEDVNGYTVVREAGNSGRYVYARLASDGNLVPTGYEVGKANPKELGLKRRMLPSAAVQALMRAGGPAAEPAESDSAPSSGSPQSSGVLKNLVVLVRFADHTSRAVPSESDIDVLMNAVGGDPNLAPAGSLRDIYLNNSYGALTIDSTVAAWATVSGTEEYYAAGASGLTTTIHQALGEALDIVDDMIDFSDFDQDMDGYVDAITFLHSGYGAEWGGTDADGTYYEDRIWSHKWALYSLGAGGWESNEGVRVYNYHLSPALWGTSGSAIGRIGVIAHETGHFLGLPDLYDTDNTPGEGIGSWGLMANSWGGDGSQQPPPLMSAWSKIKLGWLTPAELTIPGNYSLENSLNSSLVYQVMDGYPAEEYLLLENRRRRNISGKVVDNIPTNGDGLVIWHIDDVSDYNTQGYPGQPGWPENGNHYRVAVLQADGDYDLEKGNNRGDSGDAYRGGFVDAIGPASTPSTDSYQLGSSYQTGHEVTSVSSAGSIMSFDFNVGQAPNQPPGAPDGLLAAATGHYSIDLFWSDNSDNEDGFYLEQSGDGVFGWTEIAVLAPNAVSYSQTDLNPGTSYYYRILAFNSAGLSDFSNIASATTTSPLPPTAPTNLIAVAVSQYQIDLSWTDGDNETSLDILRSTGGAFTTIATIVADQSTYSDTGLQPSTTYTYIVKAVNADGTAESNQSSATTDSPPPQAFAVSEIQVAGTIEGSYSDTISQDGKVEEITEILSPANRNGRSQLEHIWQLGPISAGAQVILTVTAHGSANSEGDDFEFSYSTDGGVVFTPILTVDSSTGTQSVELPPETGGTVHLRVRDTDRTKKNMQLDTVYVDFIMIESYGEVVLSAPTNLGGTAVSASEISLTWNDAIGETGYLVYYRVAGEVPDGWSTADTSPPAGSTGYMVGGLTANTAYDFMVCAFDDYSTPQCTETDEPITTLNEDAIQPLSLTASGYKYRQYYQADLVWSGGTGMEVDIYRDGDIIAPSIQGSYTDTGLDRGGSYIYMVCEAGSTNDCSNEAPVNF